MLEVQSLPLTVIIPMLILGSTFVSCRNDTADVELSWSCANVRATPNPTATPECLKQIEGEKSDILKYYSAVPKLVDGKIVYYSFVAR